MVCYGIFWSGRSFLLTKTCILANFNPRTVSSDNFYGKWIKVNITFKAIEKYRYGLQKIVSKYYIK